MSQTHKTTLTLLALALAGSVQAHVTLETRSAEAGSYYKAVLKVGHGCEGSAVKQVIVSIPEGVQGAKPMPKAGWQIDIQRTRLPKSYTSHGKTITEDVSQVSWTGGPLPDAHYDEFVLAVKLPEQPGKLYWKVSQICEQGRIDWAEVPVEGRRLSDYKAPAALLEIRPKAAPEHQH